MNNKNYNFSLVLRQWRLLALYLIVFPVLIRTHCGIGLFCLSFLASFRLIMNVLWADIAPLRSTTWQKRNNAMVAQQIAAWKLLYRVQHPARYVSRLQTIPSSDIELEFTHDRPSGSQVGRGKDRSRRWPGGVDVIC
jgi:hypothetical protein